MSNNERYDKIGIGYDSTRKADPYLAQRMYDLIHSGKANSLYLDVGCGTGNYTSALNAKGLRFIGIEPSEEMLDKARVKNETITWKKGYAESLDLASESVDGVLVSLTIHHWKDLNKGFQEIARVLKKDGKVVLFTTLPEQTKAYWLYHYFPKMIEDSIKILPKLEVVKAAFSKAGLKLVEQEPYFVKPDLEDWFLYCGKHDPERYFNEDIRKGISSFSLIAHQKEVEKGLQKLRADIDNGTIKNVMKEYENDMGDYLFLVGKTHK
ncbi:MAG: class I SAM-dependent methyltransferase [Bacteroidota bacterium]